MGRRDQAEQTRQTLVLAAASVFDRRGFSGTSLQHVCTEAACTKGALYFHFPSKQALALAVIEAQRQVWVGVVNNLRLPRRSALQTLIDLSYEIANRLASDLLVRAGVRLVLDADVVGEHHPTPLPGWVEITQLLLGEAVQEREIGVEVDLAAAADAIVAGIAGLRFLTTTPSRRSLQVQRVSQMWQLWLAGLTTPQIRAELRLDPPTG